MFFIQFSSKYYVFFIACVTIQNFSYAIPPEMCDKGFVYLSQIDPTIIISPRYYSEDNFVGKNIRGYKKNTIILTKQAAEALKKVQEDLNKEGYDLVVYDGYRPQDAVDYFVEWSKNIEDQTQKLRYYPRVDKEKVFDLGYVAKRSGHSRGSTVDLTIIKKGQALHKIKEENRILRDGFGIKFLNDGTVDMGSSFDLFDEASHFDSDIIDDESKKLRIYLKEKMEKHGFKNYAEEWWHFTLKNEPFSADKEDSYFTFAVE